SESSPEVKIQITNSSLNSNFSLDLNRSDENNREPNIVFELKNSIKSNSIPINLINDDFSFKCSMSSDERSSSYSNQKDFAGLCKLLHKKKVSYISKITPASALQVKTKDGGCVGLKPKVLINLLSRQSLLIIFIPQKNDNISLAEECRIQDATDFSTSLSQTSTKFVSEWVKKCNNTDTANKGSDDDINSFEFCSLNCTPTSNSNYNKSPKNKDSLSRKRSSSGKLNRSLSIISMSMQSSSSSANLEKINSSKDQIQSFDSKQTDDCDEGNDACKNLNMCIDFCKKLTKPLISHYTDILKSFNGYLQALSGTECIQSHFILLQ
ncbi:MAG: hypothetical protein MHMPM18_003996, partial [Marteilia pararefringens]